MPEPRVAAQGGSSKQKNTEWENLLGAAHLELHAQQTGPVLETGATDAAAAANAQVTSSPDTSCGVGDDRHEMFAAPTRPTMPGFSAYTRSTRSGGGGIVSSRRSAQRSDRDDATSLPAHRPKAFLGHGSIAASTGGNSLPETATANDLTAGSRPVVAPPVAFSRRTTAYPWTAGSTSVAVGSNAVGSSTTLPPPPAPTAFGMVAAAASGVVLEKRDRGGRVQAKEASEGPVGLDHPRVKAMGRRGPMGQSHFKGVSITRAGTWRAVIYKGRKQQYLGVFDSEFDAARAYDAAALRLFPEGAPLNNPDIVEQQLNEISAADGKPIATAGTPNLRHEESPQAWEV